FRGISPNRAPASHPRGRGPADLRACGCQLCLAVGVPVRSSPGPAYVIRSPRAHVDEPRHAAVVMSDFGQHQRTGWIETVVGGVSAGKTEAVVLRARRALLA